MFLEQDKILKLISETDFWKNFEFFFKYPNTNKTNEDIRHNLQNQIGHNFLYLSILKKYNPAMLVGGVKYALGVGVEKKCEIATQFLKEVSFQNIAGKINDPDMKGNFVFTRFRLEIYEHIENIYKKDNQLTTLESLYEIYNLLKDDKDISKKKEVINEIGLRYFYGIGVEKDYKQAKEWFEYGTSYNIGQCYAFLGEIYLHGFGLKKEEIDYKKANSLFNQAIINGDPAMGYSGLGYIYYYGLGVKKDKREAYNYFLKGIRISGKDSSWATTSLYFNMISLLIEDDSDDDENYETKSFFNDIFVDFDIKEQDEINNNIKIEDIEDNNKNDIKQNINSNTNEKITETNYNNNNKIKDEKEENSKVLFDKKVPKDFNLAYKYANYLTLKNRSYGTYILAMMNEYNINSKLFSCEENLNFFRATSDTNEDTIKRIELSRKLYENKKYRSAFLVIIELAYEGNEDSLHNIIALLTKRQIFKNHDYQKFLTYYFIEFGLKLEYYDLFFLSISAQFLYKEHNYKKAIDLYKLLINHAGGNDKKFYVAEGFFNLGLMENFGYGLPKNLSKSYKFFEKAENYEVSSYYPVKTIKIVNSIMSIFGNEKYRENYYVNKTINDTNPKKSIFKNIFRNFNLFSLAITIFLLFYGWFFFNLKLQDSDTSNAI
jgi:TPR repeat protein